MTSTRNIDTSQTPLRLDAEREIVVIGAGPAGLTAAFQLHKHGLHCTVLEADDQVGGISRTVQHDGWRFDIGGHRFFTKVRAVDELWHEILPAEDFLLRPRKSRIFYDGKYFDYPLKPGNALRNLGPIEAARCVGSYLWARVRPPADQTNYEGWLVARFGWRLYRTFFKTYTEKVWGVPVSEMPADSAAQRIKSLSLGKAIAEALRPRRNQTEITSLIEEFQYPKYGPGTAEAASDLVNRQTFGLAEMTRQNNSAATLFHPIVRRRVAIRRHRTDGIAAPWCFRALERVPPHPLPPGGTGPAALRCFAGSPTVAGHGGGRA